MSADSPAPSSSGGKPLTLDQFLKQQGWVGTGGHAKMVIQDGLVTVNGEIETRRGRKLKPGDGVTFEDQSAIVSP